MEYCPPGVPGDHPATTLEWAEPDVGSDLGPSARAALATEEARGDEQEDRMGRAG